MMDLNQQKEKFSEVYLRAVATVAGCTLYKPEVDDDSVDFGIASRYPRRPRVEVQLKCTATDVLRDDGVHFPLEIRNYEHLRTTELLVPRVLVVVLVPQNVGDWLEQSEHSLVLHRCGYWLSLRGGSPTKNTETVTVVLPRTNVLSPEALRAMLERIARGGTP